MVESELKFSYWICTLLTRTVLLEHVHNRLMTILLLFNFSKFFHLSLLQFKERERENLSKFFNDYSAKRTSQFARQKLCLKTRRNVWLILFEAFFDSTSSFRRKFA